MPRNADPIGPVPAEDDNGRLVLNQTKAGFARTALFTFLMGCAAWHAAVFWHDFLVLDILPPDSDIRGRVLGFLSVLAWPVLPLLLLYLAFPPRLVVDADGITARAMARTRRLGWEEMREIRLREITMGRGGKTQTQTTVSGPNFGVNWMPVYGVAPRALAEYLVARRRAARPTVPLELVEGTAGQLSAGVGKAMDMSALLHLALVLALGVFAFIVTLAASSAIHGGPLAVFLFGR